MVDVFEDECEGCEENVEKTVHHGYVDTHSCHDRGHEKHFHGPPERLLPELLLGDVGC